jgi:hypothetical protein
VSGQKQGIPGGRYWDRTSDLFRVSGCRSARLGDAGPHPNKAHAAWGRRAHRLEPDPATAPVVQWMFAQRLAGPRGTPACWPGSLHAGRAGEDWNQPGPTAGLAYLCRHGYTSAVSPDSGRAKNTYVREDQILPHLATIAILLAGPAGKPGRGSQVTGPAGTAALIDRLRAGGVALTYDPGGRTLRAGDNDAPSVTIGKDH